MTGLDVETLVIGWVHPRTEVTATMTSPLPAVEPPTAGQHREGVRRTAGAIATRRHGWGPGQFSCLESLWERESSWRRLAANPSSGAYGIPQALPGSKMSEFGADWRTAPVTQIRWWLSYIESAHGTPCGAWSTFKNQGWY